MAPNELEQYLISCVQGEGKRTGLDKGVIASTPDWLLDYQDSGRSFAVAKGSLRAHRIESDEIHFDRISNIAVGDYSVVQLPQEHVTIHYRDPKGEVRVNAIPASSVTVIAGLGKRRYTFTYAFLNPEGKSQ